MYSCKICNYLIENFKNEREIGNENPKIIKINNQIN